MNTKQYNSKSQRILNFDAINSPTAGKFEKGDSKNTKARGLSPKGPYKHLGGWGCRTMKNSGKKWVWCNDMVDLHKKRPYKKISRKQSPIRHHKPVGRCPEKYPHYCPPNPKVNRGFGFCANKRAHCGLSSENMRIHDPYIPRKQCSLTGTGDFCASNHRGKAK